MLGCERWPRGSCPSLLPPPSWQSPPSNAPASIALNTSMNFSLDSDPGLKVFKPTSLLIPHMVQVALVLPARCQSWPCILQWLSQLLSLLQYKWHETTPAAIRNRADATVALPSLGLHSSNIDSPPSLGLHLPKIKLPPCTNSRPLTCCRDWTHAL